MTFDAKLNLLRFEQTLAIMRKHDVKRLRDRALDRRTYDSRAYETQRHAQASQGVARQQESRSNNSLLPAADRYVPRGRPEKVSLHTKTLWRRQLRREIKSARVWQQGEAESIVTPGVVLNDTKHQATLQKCEAKQFHTQLVQAERAIERASVAIASRIEFLVDQKAKEIKARPLVVKKAGIPHRYINDVWVSIPDEHGTRNIYFGGEDGPLGPGHGHYALNKKGHVTYRRAPFDPRGVHNFLQVTGPEATPYQKSVRYDQVPLPDGGVVVSYRTDAQLRVEQRFSDKFHVSWDVLPDGSYLNVRWTNGNIPAGHPDRYRAPEDATI